MSDPRFTLHRHPEKDAGWLEVEWPNGGFELTPLFDMLKFEMDPMRVLPERLAEHEHLYRDAVARFLDTGDALGRSERVAERDPHAA